MTFLESILLIINIVLFFVAVGISRNSKSWLPIIIYLLIGATSYMLSNKENQQTGVEVIKNSNKDINRSTIVPRINLRPVEVEPNTKSTIVTEADILSKIEKNTEDPVTVADDINKNIVPFIDISCSLMNENALYSRALMYGFTRAEHKDKSAKAILDIYIAIHKEIDISLFDKSTILKETQTIAASKTYGQLLSLLLDSKDAHYYMQIEEILSSNLSINDL